MSLDSKRDLLIDAGAALREVGLRAGPFAAQIDRAVWEVGQAIYGRNSAHFKLQREAVRAALRIVERVRDAKGAPAGLGQVLVLLRTALRNLKGR